MSLLLPRPIIPLFKSSVPATQGVMNSVAVLSLSVCVYFPSRPSSYTIRAAGIRPPGPLGHLWVTETGGGRQKKSPPLSSEVNRSQMDDTCSQIHTEKTPIYNICWNILRPILASFYSCIRCSFPEKLASWPYLTAEWRERLIELISGFEFGNSSCHIWRNFVK